jgi:hypothetical protein
MFCFSGRETGNLREARVHSTNLLTRIKEQDAFLDPFEDVLEFRFRAALLEGLLTRGRALKLQSNQVISVQEERRSCGRARR